MQATAKPPHAGRVVLLQKERTLQRLSHGKVIESHLAGRRIAVTNEQNDEIWAAVTEGTPFEIRP